MNFSLEGYDIANITIDFMNYIKKINETLPIHRFREADYWFFNLFMKVITPTIFISIVAIGLISNLVVILGKCRRFPFINNKYVCIIIGLPVILLNQQMHSTTNYLIVNLGVADILFVTFCAPYTAYEYYTTIWGLGDTACKLSNYFVHVTLHVSVYTLALMAVDRFIAVVYPVSGMSWRTDRNTLVAIILLWITSFGGLVPVIFRFEESYYYHLGIEKSTCMIIGSHTSNVFFTVSVFAGTQT